MIPLRARASLRIVWIAALCLLAAPAAARAAEAADVTPVDVALVLAADVSRSINDDEFALQRQGYAKAIQSPEVMKAITGGSARAIGLCFIEWAGDGEEAVLVDWSLIRNQADARAFAAKLLAAPRSFIGRTAIGAGIDFAVGRLSQSGLQATRRVVDVSGDGTNNQGRAVTEARDQAVKAGIIINGLAIINTRVLAEGGYLAFHTNPEGGLPNYYQQNVIGGLGAFMLQVDGFHTFGEAMIQKLTSEIAAIKRPVQLAGEIPREVQ